MYRPSGTGKMMLTQAAANKCGMSFLKADAATIISKYVGDSARIVKVLFKMVSITSSPKQLN